MNTDREVISVREEEQLDRSALEPWLRVYLPETEGAFAIEQFGGGHANLTYLIRFGDTEYVLRRPPLGRVAPSSHDMAREHKVLKDLWRTFPLAPQSFVLCEDTEVIGAPFHVMERRLGFVIRRELPPDRNWSPALNQRLGEMVIDVLAALHAADPDVAGLGDLGRPGGFVVRQVSGWSKRWQAAVDDTAPDMSAVIAWLETNLPASQNVSLLHNDFKLDNMLVKHDDPSQAAAVLDWDMCTRGDPLMDLGYLLTYWVEPDDDPSWRLAASMPTWNTGFPSRMAAIQRYATATGFDCSAVHWYHVFGNFKIAAILQQIYIRYLRGQTSDERFSAFGQRIHTLHNKAMTLIGAA